MRVPTPPDWPARVWLGAGVGVVVLAAIILSLFGQPWICTCGQVKLWHGVVVSSENSQHITDWYSFTHILHGFAFYVGLWLLVRDWPLPVRAFTALVIEAGWEVLENTPFIIERYREQTIALDYYGDSIINTVFDIGFAMAGFWLAWRLPIWATVALGLAIEIVLLIAIRDNLTLNILMLWWPVEAIKDWQAGG